MTVISREEAERLERSFISNLGAAQDVYERIVEHQAWQVLGYDTFSAWWEAKVRPLMRALALRPTRELAAAVVDQVRAEEAALPPLQRRTQQELAELAGVHRDTVAGRKRRDRSEAELPPGDDLGEPLTDAEKAKFRERETTIRAGLDRLDDLILYALSNRIAPEYLAGCLTKLSYTLAEHHNEAEFLDPIRRHVIEPRIQYVLTQGAAITEDLAGPDVERLPLTEEEVTELGQKIARGGL